MKEELKREIEENGIQDTAFYDVYKTSTGLYVIDDICKEFGVGDSNNTKVIKENLCYQVSDKDIDTINKESLDQAVRLIPDIVTIFDLQLVLSFTVYVDKNHDNLLYISDNTCSRYGIVANSKRTIHGSTYCNVTEEDITKIEETTKKEKIAFKRKYIEIALEDEIKPAEYLFIYYYDFETQKNYVRRDMYELFNQNGVSIEGNPKIIDNKNCYSITENELKEVETKIGYRGVEQLLKPNAKLFPMKKVNYPNDDDIKNIVNQIYEIKNRENLFERANTYDEQRAAEISFPDDKDALEQAVKPYLDRVMPYLEKPEILDRVMPYIEKPEVLDRVMPYIESKMVYHTTEEDLRKPFIIYMNKKTGILYIPTEKALEKDKKIVTVMHKPCFEITYADLDKYKEEKIVIVSVFVVEKETYDILICNNNGQLFISESILGTLGFYIEKPHRILINKEIYEEIAPEDLELIQGLESETLHINITMKQIAPKRG